MLEIHALSIGPIATNCYIVRHPSGRCFVVDPGCDWQPILDAVQGLEVTRYPDHPRALGSHRRGRRPQREDRRPHLGPCERSTLVG